MNQKGLASLIAISLVVVVIGIIGYFVLVQKPTIVTQKTPNQAPTQTPIPQMPPSLVIRVKPLLSDQDHDVLTITECDLAVRYNKKTFVPVTVFVNAKREGSEGYYFRANPLKSLQIYEDYSAVDAVQGSGGPARIGIECFPPGIIKDGNTKTIFAPLFTRANTLVVVTVDKNAFCAAIGLETNSCERIIVFKKFLATEKGNNYDVSVWETNNYSYIFADKTGGAIKIVAQINSLEPSTPTIDLNSPQFKYYNW